MGRRRLRVSPEFLIEFLKQREDWPRAFTVSPALPDDVRLTGHEGRVENASLTFVLESAYWEGEEGEIQAPRFTVHLLDPVLLEAATRSI